MKVVVNRKNKEIKGGDLVIDRLGNIGILTSSGHVWVLEHPGKPIEIPTLVSRTDSDNWSKFDGTVILSND